MPPKIKVIVVDDKSLFRHSLKSLLDEFNIDVISEAENGCVLLEQLNYIKPDAILLDIEMPVMDGSEALDIIVAKHAQIPVIMLSQYDEVAVVENFIERGAAAYLTKNDRIENIVNTIARVVNEGINPTQSNRKSKFSNREKEIIPLVCSSKSNEEIAKSLGISVKTVESHRKQIFTKTNSISFRDFIVKAYCQGLRFLKKSGGGGK